MKQVIIEITFYTDEDLRKALAAIAIHILTFKPLFRSGKIVSIHGLSRWRIFDESEKDMLNLVKIEE